jgi:hypothetical protein
MAVPSEATVASDTCTIDGPGVTVTMATLLVTEPATFVTTTEYAPPSLFETLFKMSELVVAPGTGVPLNSHW